MISPRRLLRPASNEAGAALGRVVVSLSVLAILIICLLAGSYMQSALDRLRETHQTFNDRQLRNGYVAMSDVQRLVLILQEALTEGGMSQQAETEFRSAADFLYVRIVNFQRVLEDSAEMDSALNAIATLKEIQRLIDDALADNLSDLPGLTLALTTKSQEARQALVAYLDDMRRLQDRLLLSQSQAVEQQRRVVWATLAAMSIIAVGAVLLIRQDYVSRNARRAAEGRVRHLAFFDGLTGLPNRVHFQDQLSHMLACQDRVVLMLIDMDGFKIINDTHGHAAGDAALRHVGTALLQLTAARDGFAARLGGDEFAIILRGDDLVAAEQLSADLHAAVSAPIAYEGRTLHVGLSIGVAASTQLSRTIGVTVDTLSRVADFALYAAKSSTQELCTIYDQALEAQFMEQRAMVEELPGAIRDGSLTFALQPKVRLDTGLIYGFEALARWHRNGRVTMPQGFIPLLEESGLIAQVDYAILDGACQHLAAFNRAYGTELSVSVNFSSLHFRSSKLAIKVKEVLEESGLRPDLLTLEITETAEIGDWQRAKETITALHAIGARVSIDDFGAGFSSLAYLRTTIADEIKIDRSLVEDIETSDRSRFLLDSVIDIANSLDLEVTVEGIETAQQAEIVEMLGARNAQGYYFGKPMEQGAAFELVLQQNDQARQAV